MGVPAKTTLELWRTDELLRLAATGGGFKIDGRPRSIGNLARIAATAARTGARIELRNMHDTPLDQLLKIAAAGPGAVVFDLDPPPSALRARCKRGISANLPDLARKVTPSGTT